LLIFVKNPLKSPKRPSFRPFLGPFWVFLGGPNLSPNGNKALFGAKTWGVFRGFRGPILSLFRQKQPIRSWLTLYRVPKVPWISGIFDPKTDLFEKEPLFGTRTSEVFRGIGGPVLGLFWDLFHEMPYFLKNSLRDPPKRALFGVILRNPLILEVLTLF
jgi:hypothetical protein